MALDVAAIRKAYQQRMQSRKTRRLSYSLKQGANVIRILPPPEGQSLCWFDAGIHYGLNMKYCRQACVGEPCPVCEASEVLISSTDRADREFGGQLKATSVYFFPVIIRGKEGFGPKLLRVPEGVGLEIIGYLCDDDEPVDLTDPKKGFDINIVREGMGKNKTKYNIKLRPKQVPLGTDEQISSWLEDYPDWEAFCEQEVDSYEDLENLIKKGGMTSEEAVEPEDEDDSETSVEEADDEDFVEDDDIPFEAGEEEEEVFASDAAETEESSTDSESDVSSEDDYDVDEETGEVRPKSSSPDKENLTAKEARKAVAVQRLKEKKHESPEDIAAAMKKLQIQRKKDRFN